MCASAGRRLPWELDGAKSATTVTTKRSGPRTRRQKAAADVMPASKRKRQMKANYSGDDFQEQELDQCISASSRQGRPGSAGISDVQNASGGSDVDDSAMDESLDEEEEMLDTGRVHWLDMEPGDEMYRMVEDEFFDVAREYAASLHAAELADLRSQAADPPSSQHFYDSSLSSTSKSTLLVPGDFGADKNSKLAVLMTSPIKRAADLDAHLKSPTTIRRRPAAPQRNSTSDVIEDRDTEEKGDIIDQLLRESSMLPAARKRSPLLRSKSSGRRRSSTADEEVVTVKSSKLNRHQIEEDSSRILPETGRSKLERESTVSDESERLTMLNTSKEHPRKDRTDKGVSLKERVALRRANMLKGINEEPDFMMDFLQSDMLYSDSSHAILARRKASRTKT
ncbi:hypothetical protein V1517DRAFT_199509 [Lipomyces orientalis]|uniref:Uncharacterized protein n=1 Tax=Lipomyces orientalis TaxID=1233043 RepID=A0ACC3TJ23_9ASCO